MEVFIGEADIGLVHSGQKAVVSARSAPGKEFAGSVSRVGLAARVPPGPENLEAPEEGAEDKVVLEPRRPGLREGMWVRALDLQVFSGESRRK